MTTPPSPSSSRVFVSRTQASVVSYDVPCGLSITRTVTPVAGPQAFESLIDQLDRRVGVLLASSYEYPGRYTRIDIGCVNPPVVLTATGRHVTFEALNARGEILIASIAALLGDLPEGMLQSWSATTTKIAARIADAPERIVEEERSKVPSVFSLLRVLVAGFASDQDEHLGFYGAFGYDLAFQCDAIDLKIERPQDHRDLVLFFADSILEIDHARRSAIRVDYDFAKNEVSTAGLSRDTPETPFVAAQAGPRTGDHQPGEYEQVVEKAKAYFIRGDLFETVPGQSFIEPCVDLPSAIFRRLRASTPAPYGLFLNLGQQEYLVGASPEMYVRVQGKRIETCPISGTIARSNSALGDAEQIRELLNSRKEESELTMCTDVDRNDKSRVCVPGSVRVIGRRQIEVYSKLIHTVDHVEGILADDYDGLDAFITHTWAVTVTGAPKLAAMQFIEDHEKSVRAWYGGAIGKIGFDGSINTGLTLRTIRIIRGQAIVRAGATLLFDSEPAAEARETELKASALLEALRPSSARPLTPRFEPSHGGNRRVLFVDHRDSFVHTLANYVRQTGATVMTRRPPLLASDIDELAPDLLLLSPGPGRPDEFHMRQTIDLALSRNLPIFGVCLGLQGIVEYFGGALDTLGYPVHGKPSQITCESTDIFEGVASTFTAGRYHSLVARESSLPSCLRVTARSCDDKQIMAIRHESLPIAAVQFHPESILSDQQECGLRMIDNVVRLLHSIKT